MINAMTFYDKKHLITCAEDGKVCILKTGTWNVEKTLLKHTQGMKKVFMWYHIFLPFYI